MSIKMVGLVGHVVALSTGKRLLTSVRSHVIFKIIRFNAGEVALVTLKWLLS